MNGFMDIWRVEGVFLVTAPRPNISIDYIFPIQCDAIRWEQFLRRFHLGQL